MEKNLSSYFDVRSSDLIVKEWLDKILSGAVADHRDLIVRSYWIVAEDGAFALAVEASDDVVHVVWKETSKIREIRTCSLISLVYL